MTESAFQLIVDLGEMSSCLRELQTIDPNSPYFHRFPTCSQVKDVICKDGSCYSKCPHGAYGEANASSMSVPWEACTNCRHYQTK